MSEHETTEEQTTDQAGTATAIPDEPFDRTEIEQFEADDVSAGSQIGKMLAVLFLYTVLAMSAVGVWTWCTVYK